jgi:hypothetical protein
LTEETFDRTAPRTRTLLQARIEFNGGATTVDCTVRDLSDTGARLQVAESVTIPSKFTLFVPKHGLRYHALLRWHRGSFAGVEFETEQQPEGEKLDPEARIVKLEAEVARLRRVIEAIRADPSQARLLVERFDLGSTKV